MVLYFLLKRPQQAISSISILIHCMHCMQTTFLPTSTSCPNYFLPTSSLPGMCMILSWIKSFCQDSTTHYIAIKIRGLNMLKGFFLETTIWPWKIPLATEEGGINHEIVFNRTDISFRSNSLKTSRKTEESNKLQWTTKYASKTFSCSISLPLLKLTNGKVGWLVLSYFSFGCIWLLCSFLKKLQWKDYYR